jgi:hypothetical protein
MAKRRDALATVTEDIEHILADRPQRKQYPSYEKTPAVACRVDRDDYEELKAIAEDLGIPLAHVIKAILVDFLEKRRRGEAEVGKVAVQETPEIRRFVTRVRNDL